MKTQAISLSTVAVMLLSVSCKKEEPAYDKTAAPPSESKGKPLTNTPGSSGDGQSVKNAYAEKRWKLGEPETQGEIDYEEAQTVEEKLTVIGKIQSTGPEDLAPVLRRALRHPDESLRIQAVQTTPIFHSHPNEATDIITAGTFDQSSEVRAYSLEMAVEQPTDTRLMIYGNTINSPQKDVRENTAVELGRIATKPAFEVLMQGLTNEDPEFVAKVNSEIKLLVNQEFPSWRMANSWWTENAEKFDDRMVQLVD